MDRLALKKRFLRNYCGFVNLLFLIENLLFCSLVVSQLTHVLSLVRTTKNKLPQIMLETPHRLHRIWVCSRGCEQITDSKPLFCFS